MEATTTEHTLSPLKFSFNVENGTVGIGKALGAKVGNECWLIDEHDEYLGKVKLTKVHDFHSECSPCDASFVVALGRGAIPIISSEVENEDYRPEQLSVKVLDDVDEGGLDFPREHLEDRSEWSVSAGQFTQFFVQVKNDDAEGFVSIFKTSPSGVEEWIYPNVASARERFNASNEIDAEILVSFENPLDSKVKTSVRVMVTSKQLRSFDDIASLGAQHGARGTFTCEIISLRHIIFEIEALKIETESKKPTFWKGTTKKQVDVTSRLAEIAFKSLAGSDDGKYCFRGVGYSTKTLCLEGDQRLDLQRATKNEIMHAVQIGRYVLGQTNFRTGCCIRKDQYVNFMVKCVKLNLHAKIPALLIVDENGESSEIPGIWDRRK